MVDAKELKRLVRAMNSVLNLYDVDGLPEGLVDVMMEGIVAAADILGLTEIADYDKETGVLKKYKAPEDFNVWLITNGGRLNAE